MFFLCLVLVLQGATPLQKPATDAQFRKAVWSTDLKGVRSALAAGADVNQLVQHGGPDEFVTREPGQKNAVMLTALHGSPAILRLLIKAGADVNRVNDNGDTALSLAHDCDECIHVLLAAGADVHGKPATQLMESLLDRYHDLSWYNSPGQRRTDKIRALRAIEFDFRDLLARGADPNTRFEYGVTLLYRCAAMYETGLLSVVLHHGGNPNLQDDSGETPLWSAVDTWEPRVIRVLLRAHADVNVRNHRGETVLARAQWTERIELIEPLVRAGAHL